MWSIAHIVNHGHQNCNFFLGEKWRMGEKIYLISHSYQDTTHIKVECQWDASGIVTKNLKASIS